MYQLGVLLLFKISRNLIEFKPFKTSCERSYIFLNKNRFLKKCSNFNKMSLALGSCVQIR